MKVGFDIMGGDYGPRVTVGGAITAFNHLPKEVKLVLFGDREQILPLLKELGADHNDFDIVHTSEVIEMAESPMKAVTQKTDSSIVVGFQYLKDKKIDAFSSNGNTGAMMVSALKTVKAIKGVQRPCLITQVPMTDGTIGTLLDVGSNADCRPEMLCQFALLGQIYTQYINNTAKPRVALLNIGEEEEKGNLVAQATYQLLKEKKYINFIGNIEARDIFDGKADVIVCEGFVGNVVLKQAEAVYKILRKRNIHDDYFDRFNYEVYGGTPILGVNAPAVIGHGINNEEATKNMIFLSMDMVKKGVVTHIQEAFHSYLNQESNLVI